MQMKGSAKFVLIMISGVLTSDMLRDNAWHLAKALTDTR